MFTDDHIGDEPPGAELRRVLRLAIVVLGKAEFEIVGDADIAPVGEVDAFDEVDIVHGL